MHPQSEGFTGHERWDFERTPPEQYPLLLHFPYFDLYRKQVVKQADLVLALHLCGDAFSAEEKARDFDYYEALTVRDSSLSACTQAVVAAEVGHLELAYDYFGEAALMDLRRPRAQHPRRRSTWPRWPAPGSPLVAGFGGMRDHDGELTSRRGCRTRLTRLAFGVLVRGRTLRVEVGRDAATYSVAGGDALDIAHHGEDLVVEPGRPVSRPIPPAPERTAPSPAPRARAPPPPRGPRGLGRPAVADRERPAA